jgi:hypothetical protein
MNQTHSQFKVFVGSGQNLIQTAASAFSSYQIAPKSLGVEFIEAADVLVITLGYRDDEPAYQFGLTEVNLGKLDLVPAAIADALGDAAAKLENVICHEFYVNKEGEFFAVFLTKL